MVPNDALGLFVGAIGLGAIHGVEPGHGWPVAATYALDRTHQWFYGLAASAVLGVGHLLSSVAMVVTFFYAKSWLDLARVNEPIAVAGGAEIGGPVSVVAGLLLVALGAREYAHGHDHAAPREHDHSGESDHPDGHAHPAESGHPDGHGHADSYATPNGGGSGFLAGLKRRLREIGRGHSHERGHTHHELDGTADRGLAGIAWFAFLLGFAHEEEFEIIALCAGSSYCLELMLAYALAVLIAIVGATVLLIAGYERFEERVERITPYLPAVSAAVLIVMGLGFIAGVF